MNITIISNASLFSSHWLINHGDETTTGNDSNISFFVSLVNIYFPHDMLFNVLFIYSLRSLFFSLITIITIFTFFCFVSARLFYWLSSTISSIDSRRWSKSIIIAIGGCVKYSSGLLLVWQCFSFHRLLKQFITFSFRWMCDESRSILGRKKNIRTIFPHWLCLLWHP